MTTHVQTDLELMSAGARHVDNVSEQLRDELSALMNSLSDLQTEWQGRSGLMFDDLKVQFDAKLQTLYARLQELAGIVEKNGQAYGIAQQDQLYQLEEVNSVLGGSTGSTNITAGLMPKGAV